MLDDPKIWGRHLKQREVVTIAGNTQEFQTVPSTIIESQLNYTTAVKLEIETKFSNLIWINIAFHMHYTPAFDSWVKGLPKSAWSKGQTSRPKLRHSLCIFHALFSLFCLAV